jgi:hypothetical protein
VMGVYNKKNQKSDRQVEGEFCPRITWAYKNERIEYCRHKRADRVANLTPNLNITTIPPVTACTESHRIALLQRNRRLAHPEVLLSA